MSGMVMVEQRRCSRALQPWLLSRDDRRMDCLDHDERLAAVRAGLKRHPSVRSALAEVSNSEVERALAALHESRYACAIAQVASDEPILMRQFAAPGMSPDTPVSASLAVAAFEGVRTAIAAAEWLVAGERFAYALCRPPGHHAGPSWLGGSCLFNNAAAAAYTLREKRITPVGILDLDIHYPNGTAAIVARMPDTRVCSLHSWPVVNVASQTAFPAGERERLFEFRKAPAAEEYLDAVARAIEELTLVSAAIVLSLGFDTVAGDPYGTWGFPPTIFAGVGCLLASARLPVCVVQEGGYAIGSLEHCGSAFVRGLLGDTR